MKKADEKEIKSTVKETDNIDWRIIPIIKKITNLISG